MCVHARWQVPQSFVQMGCTTLSIYIPSGSRGQISVTAVSHGALKKIAKLKQNKTKKIGFSKVHQDFGLVKGQAWKTRLLLLKLRDKAKRKKIEKKKEREIGLADRCGEGRSRQTPSFLSSGGIAGILTSIVSCQVSSLLVGWVSQSWGWNRILWGLSFITASHGCVTRCTRSLCHSHFVHSNGRW